MSSPVYKEFGCTDVGPYCVEYEWVIKNFGLLPHANGEFLWSPLFGGTENDEMKWKWKLYPKHTGEDSSGTISLFLYLHSPDAANTKVEVEYALSIYKSESLKWSMSFQRTFQYEEKKGFGGTNIERSNLVDSSDSDHSIMIRCKVSTNRRITTRAATNPSIKPVSFDFQERQLYAQFSQLFGDSRFSDVTIIAGPKRFTAHKVILAMRSTVFAAMFEHKETEENRKNEVKIDDLEAATVEGMLEFVYKDQVTNLEILAHELLKASDKYDLDRLKVMCVDVIYKALTIDNAAEVLVVSDLYHAHDLKEHVMEHIDVNLGAVIKTEGYKTMAEMYPALLNELVHAIAARRGTKA